MKSFKGFTTILFVLTSSIGYSQSVVSGILKDSLTDQPLDDAQVMLLEKDQVVYSDVNGFFSVDLGRSTNGTLKVIATGYQTGLISITSSTTPILIRLKPQHLDLQEVTVSGLAVQSRNQNAFHIETRKVSALNALPTLNMGELISKIPGVYQAGLGMGISKPVIRGLQGMRIVSLMNGMRIEAQQWGGDHGMGMAELGIGSVEVIKGPVSLIYGADALGGVIHYTDLAPAAVGFLEGQFQLLGHSVSMGGVSRLTLRQSGTKWRYMVAGSMANHADFRLPSGKYAENSRFNEEVLRGVVSYTSRKGLHHLRYTYNRTITGIPGHTHDSIVNYSDFQVTDQKRHYTLPAQFFNNHYLSFDNKWFFKRIEFYALAAFTQNRLIEYDEKVTIPSLSMTLRNLMYNVRYTLSGTNWKWISGVMGMGQSNLNAQNASDLLIPNSSTFDNGAYTTFLLSDKYVNFQGGLRYDLRTINVLPDSMQRTFNFRGVNGAFGLVYHKDKFIFRTMFSSGFRAPHLTELLSNGFHHGALRFEIGDATLLPEKATQLDITGEWQTEHISFILNPYVNYIRDFISLQPVDSVVEAIPVFNYSRVPEVYFYGFDAGFHFHPHFLHELHLEMTGSFIDTYSQRDSSIAFIPQPRVQTQLKYELNIGSKLKIKEIVFQHVWMGNQSRISFYETPSKRFNVLDIGLNFSIGQKETIEWSVGCKNLLNETYIDHLSRLKNIQMPGPGRNIYVNLKYNLKTKINSNENKNDR
jgi:iron complex outermembrane receptor protein